MKTLMAVTLLAAGLAVAGCSTAASGSPASALTKQVSDLQAENSSLKERVKSLEGERDELKKQLQGDASPVQAKIGRDKAVEIALGAAKNVEVSHLRLVEFQLQHPQRWVTVYLVDLVSQGDKRPAGSMIIDAATGQVLSASNPPSGQ